MIFRRTGLHPRIKSEGRLFPHHAQSGPIPGGLGRGKGALLCSPARPERMMRQKQPMKEKLELDFIAPQVAAELGAWLAHLGGERNYSPKTVEAYRRDVVQFLGFLAGHLGGSPSLKALARLAPADVRALLA